MWTRYENGVTFRRVIIIPNFAVNTEHDDDAVSYTYSPKELR